MPSPLPCSPVIREWLLNKKSRYKKKLTILLTLISPYLTKFMKHNKLNTALLREIVIIFSPIYLSEATFVISSFNLTTEL